MSHPGRFAIALITGVVMTGIGAYIAARPLWTPVPITGSRVLDMVFGVLFLLRGVMNLRSLGRLRARG